MELNLRIVVTGSTGLLGSTACEILVADGHHVIALGRDFPKQEEGGAERVFADLAQSGFSALLPGKVDAIIHLAQSANYRDFPSSASEVFRVNLGSTQELLDYAAKSDVGRFIYASSGGVYESGAFAFQEESKLQTPREIDFYLASKLGGELLAQSYRGIFNHTILRFFFIYGRGQRRTMLLPRLYDQVSSGQEIFLEGKDGLVINPVHVFDAATAVVNSLGLSGSHTINVAGPDQISLGEIVAAFGNHLGVEPKLNCSTAQNPRLVADLSKMTEFLGQPAKRLTESIGDIAPDHL